MYGDLSGQCSAWKQADFKRVSADTLITKKPCYVFWAKLLSNSSGIGSAYLRDGHNTGGEILIELGAPTSDRDVNSYPWPVYFKQGLFIDVVSNVTSVQVLYMIEPKKDGED